MTIENGPCFIQILFRFIGVPRRFDGQKKLDKISGEDSFRNVIQNESDSSERRGVPQTQLEVLEDGVEAVPRIPAAQREDLWRRSVQSIEGRQEVFRRGVSECIVIAETGKIDVTSKWEDFFGH